MYVLVRDQLLIGIRLFKDFYRGVGPVRIEGVQAYHGQGAEKERFHGYDRYLLNQEALQEGLACERSCILDMARLAIVIALNFPVQGIVTYVFANLFGQ